MATETPAPSKDDEVPPPVIERSVPKPTFTDAEAGAKEFPSSTSRTYNYFTPAKKRATVYEDVTVDIQPDPDRHLLQGWVYGFADGTGGYPQEWTALKSSNWHEFLDPNEEWEQTIYRNNANVVRQIHQNLENARAARAFDNWNRGWITVVQRHVSAWAHVEHGIGMHVYLPANRDAPTNMINNALAVAAAHKLRFGQDMILYNLELSEEIEGFDGEAHKEAWNSDPVWQGVRRNVEELTAIRDWAEAFFAATVVFEPLVGELFRSEFVMQAAAPQGDFVTPTLMGAGESDTARDARVSRRLFSMLADDDEHGEENRRTMQGWLNEWAPKSLAAGRAMQPIWSQPGEKVIRFEESLEHARARFDERLTELNLDGKDLA
ncbi:MAG: aromatic/alkene monooxygenase hydroxylase subunit beta [Solirubrobacteraceae bacterium]|jgi:propane monooxygenase small subunit